MSGFRFRASGSGQRTRRKSQSSESYADDSLDLSLCYEIQSIPTLVYFGEGKPCFRIVGTASKEAILAKIKTFSTPTITQSGDVRRYKKVKGWFP